MIFYLRIEPIFDTITINTIQTSAVTILAMTDTLRCPIIVYKENSYGFK